MKVRNPKNKIRFSYVGYKTISMAINKSEYNIMLTSDTQIEAVTVTAKRRLNAGGLAIPERELSYATQTISAKQFEGLGLTRWMRRCRDVFRAWTSFLFQVTWEQEPVCACAVHLL